MEAVHFIRTYEAAAAHERAAWLEVRDAPPGTAGFDEDAWKRWVDAAQMTAAAAELLAAVVIDPPSGT